MNIFATIEQGVATNASDIHLVFGQPVKYRINGELFSLDEPPLTDEELRQVAEFLADYRFEEIKEIGELDMAYTFPGNVRTRINIFRQQRHFSIAIRILANRIPELSELGLPPAVHDFTKLQNGIVLVCGETGSGKSTTLAAILNEINHTRAEHIVTLEDPIEYIYDSDLCLINQREVGLDTRSYADGLRAVLREDPDIILIGEMRDLKTIETALTAAETGHLVFATVHTISVSDAVDRIVDVFPAEQQKQVRLQLSMTLRAVLRQQLLPKRDGSGRVVACELMMVNAAIKNLIREGKTPQMQNVVATGARDGSVPMDTSLLNLYKAKLIDAETCHAAANDPEYVGRIVMR